MVFFSISSRHFVSMLHCIMKMSDFGDNNFLLELFSFIFIFHVDPFSPKKTLPFLTDMIASFAVLVLPCAIPLSKPFFYPVLFLWIDTTAVLLNRYHCHSLRHSCSCYRGWCWQQWRNRCLFHICWILCHSHFSAFSLIFFCSLTLNIPLVTSKSCSFRSHW